MHSVEFKTAFERLKEAIKYYDEQNDQNYEVAKTFCFLTEGRVLSELAFWRNRIMHNGTTLPNIFLLDYLVTQQIIPLINKVIKTDEELLKNRLPHYFETLTGLKIIEEIEKIKFNYTDFNNPNEENQIGLKLLKIGHLKEIGRANFLLDKRIGHNSSYYDSFYKNPIDRNERFALSEENHESFHAIKKCPCCGLKTLVVYRDGFFDIIENKDSFISWFNCITCQYSLKNNLGDPHYFGLSDTILFAEK